MIDTKLNKKRLASHWNYYRVRYVVFLVLAVFVANLLFSVTKPQAPANRRVDIIIVSSVLNADAIDAWQQNLLSLLPPDQMEVNIENLMIVQGQESTVQQTIVARMAAKEGTIWIMTSDYFTSFARGGAFQPLDSDISSFNVPPGTNLAAGKVGVQPDESQPAKEELCGIPMDKAAGLSDYFVPIGMVMAFPSYSDANYENAKIVANDLLSTAQPADLTQAPAAKQVNLIVAAHAFASDGFSGWQKGINAVLPTGQGANVSALKYYTGREDYAAGLIQSRLQAQAGALCVVSRDVFISLARTGALLPLENEASSLKVPEGADLSAGREFALNKDKSAGPVHLYGIPLDGVSGLSAFFNPQGMFLAFIAPAKDTSAVNHEGAVAAANWILSGAAQ